MFKLYLQGVFEIAGRSSWKAANGLEGAAVAGATMIWYGVWPIFSDKNSWAPAANWLLSFALYAVIAWIALFILRLIFIAPFQIWIRDRKVGQTGLEFLFDPGDKANVRLISSLYGPTGEFFSIGIRNCGNRTLYDVTIKALDSWFTRVAIATAQTGHSTQSHNAISIFNKTELHPDAPEYVQLFGLDYHAAASSPDYIFNKVQQFTLEATARDVPAVRLIFEYNPTTRPMLKPLGRISEA